MLSNNFILPKNKIYMCGHSLGPSFKTASNSVNKALQDFTLYGVNSWNKSKWIDLPYILGSKIAKLIGAKTNEVIVCDSTVVNLFKVLKTALKLKKKRNIILSTNDNFPANLYIAHGIKKVKLVNSSEILESINEQIGVLMLTHVNYRDSSVLDMKTINSYANKYGVITVWDLSHSIGIVPINLTNSKADFAVGCTYKYLSGGPGSNAFIYANTKYHHCMKSPIQGWMGHNHPFNFEKKYTSFGIKKFMTGTPSILSMKTLEDALEEFNLPLIKKTYINANKYSAFFIEKLLNLGINVCNPKNRGGHIAFMHKNGYGFSRALIDQGFICDYRSPNLVRLCINPLYISLDNIKECIEKIQKITTNSLYLQPKYNQIQKVT